jgi:hypothetical protein
MQNGKPVAGLGVAEHRDNDLSLQHTRNKDPMNRKRIESMHLPAN